MLRVVLVLFGYVLLVRGGGGSRYGDYSAAGMPQYSMEYDSRVAAPIDEYPDRSPDAPAHLDYKYEEESRDTVKSFPVKHIDKEVWPKTNTKGRKAMKVTDIEERETEARDAVVPKYKSSRRFTKHRTRIKGDRVVRPSGRRMNYYPSRNADVNLYDRNDFEVSKEPSYKGNRDSNFELRDITPKAPRRKPRDRTIRAEKEVKYESDNDEDISKVGETYDESEETDTRNLNSRFNKKEKFRPALSVIDKMKPKSYQEYDDYEGIDMKRVNKLKKRLPDLFRRTQAIEATTSREVSVAERELKAVLGHRQRKDIQTTLPTNFLPTTFPPHAVDPLMDDQWNSFIVSNNTQRLQFPLCITIVALINYLQY